MQIGQAKEYFQLGVIVDFVAVRNPMGKGWLLGITGKEFRNWTLETKLGQPRVFSSLDTLAGIVDDIAGEGETTLSFSPRPRK